MADGSLACPGSDRRVSVNGRCQTCWIDVDTKDDGTASWHHAVTCSECGVALTLDTMATSYMREEQWYDGDVVDIDNPGTACPELDGDPHEVVKPQ